MALPLLVSLKCRPIAKCAAPGSGFNRANSDAPGVKGAFKNESVGCAVEDLRTYRNPFSRFVGRRVTDLEKTVAVVYARDRVVVNLDTVRPEFWPVAGIAISTEYDVLRFRIHERVSTSEVDEIAEDAGLGAGREACQHQGEAQNDDVDFGFFHFYGIFVNVNECKDTCF